MNNFISKSAYQLSHQSTKIECLQRYDNKPGWPV